MPIGATHHRPQGDPPDSPTVRAHTRADSRVESRAYTRAYTRARFTAHSLRLRRCASTEFVIGCNNLQQNVICPLTPPHATMPPYQDNCARRTE